MSGASRMRARWHKLRGPLLLYAYVGLGSAVGGGARALISLAAMEIAGPGFPWATLFVNVAGSFSIGFFATLTEPGGRLFVSARIRHLVMTGVFGGFTTFSLFSLETIRLATAGDYYRAALNLGASLIAWLTAVWFGHALAARFNQLRGSSSCRHPKTPASSASSLARTTRTTAGRSTKPSS